MNEWILTGYIGNHLQLSKSKNMKSVCTFSIAVDEYPKETTNWIDCVAWGKTAEFVVDYFAKGDKIEIKGRGKKETYTDQNGIKKSNTKCVVEKVGFSGKRQISSSTNTIKSVNDNLPYGFDESSLTEIHELSDDLPF